MKLMNEISFSFLQISRRWQFCNREFKNFKKFKFFKNFFSHSKIQLDMISVRFFLSLTRFEREKSINQSIFNQSKLKLVFCLVQDH